MTWQLNAYAASMIITTCILGALAVYLWSRRPTPGSVPGALLMLAVAQWSLGYAFELGSATLTDKIFWSNFNFVGITAMPIVLIIFVLQYTHHDRWLTPGKVALLAIPSVLTLIFVWTNDAHHLARSQSTLDTTGPIAVLSPVYGIAFWAFWIFAILLVFLSFTLALQAWLGAQGLYRRQLRVVLFSVLIPWVGNAIYLAGASPLYGLDLTPFSFAIAGAGMAWGFFRYRMFDVVPVAHDAIIESLRDGVLVLDAQARVVDLNPAAEQIFGRTAEQIIGQPVSRTLPVWSDWVVDESAGAATQTELVLNPAGAWRYFDVKISPLHDRHGRLTGRLIVLHDVSERKRATEALEITYQNLARQHTQLDIIVHNMADGLVVTDAEERIVLVNPVFASMLMRSSDELNRQHLSEVFEDLGQAVAKARQQPQQIVTADVVFGSKVYRALACALEAEPHLAAASDPESHRGVVTVLRDITQEIEMARIKDELVSMVSHELRTPLTSVLGFANLIHRQFTRHLQPRIAPDDSKGQQTARRILDNLEIIMGEGERLTRLINNVLDVAKMESGGIDWEFKAVMLNEIIQSSVISTRALAQDKGLVIQVDVVDEIPPLYGDRDRLVQVLTNLLSNAIKFTDQGKICVRAWLLAAGDNVPAWGARQFDAEQFFPVVEPLVAVSVTDTGIGIAEADLPKVFEKFHQVRDRASETQRPGTGLGLSICKQIVEHHAGHIWVESRLRQGSRFVFTLPIKG